MKCWIVALTLLILAPLALAGETARRPVASIPFGVARPVIGDGRTENPDPIEDSIDESVMIIFAVVLLVGFAIWAVTFFRGKGKGG